MSAEEFWKDDPQLFVSYRISFIKKKERAMEEEDFKSWLRGLYVYDGNSKLFATLKQFINNTLAGMFKTPKDNSKIDTYPSKPYFELKREEEKKEKLKQEELNRKEKYKIFENSLIYYGSIKQRYLDNLKKKGE